MMELALFSGAGGGCLGSRLLGWRKVAYVEWDPFCQSVLRSRMADGTFDEAPVFSDIRGFDGKAWEGEVDVVTGGFPCQPFSSAGRRLGADDPRNMWPDTLRVLSECAAPWALFENVRGLLSSGYFGEILAGLHGAGYSCWWSVLSAAACGAPHVRERLWMVCRREDGAGCREASPAADEGWGRLCRAAARLPRLAVPVAGGWSRPGKLLKGSPDGMERPTSGIMAGGSCRALQNVNYRDNMPGRLNTPKASSTIRFSMEASMRFQAEGRQISLEEQIKLGMLPTPNAFDSTGIGRINPEARLASGKQMMLSHVVHMLPTPMAEPTNSVAGSSRHVLEGGCLDGRFHMTLGRALGCQMVDSDTDFQSREWKSLILNPEWVEWVMGWPSGHTDPDREANGVERWMSAVKEGGHWVAEPDGIPRVVRLPEGNKDFESLVKARLKSLGNGQVPHCVAAIWGMLENGGLAMADRFCKATRSRIMRAVKGKRTGPEEKLAGALRMVGARFGRNRKDLPGSPDFILPGKVAVFVDGCFWHGCPKHYREPSSNVAYWMAKMESNRSRDAKNAADLEGMGWLVIRAWECEVGKDAGRLADEIVKASEERKTSK